MISGASGRYSTFFTVQQQRHKITQHLKEELLLVVFASPFLEFYETS
jgi:hypothetical protein